MVGSFSNDDVSSHTWTSHNDIHSLDTKNESDENLNEITYDRIYTGERIRDIIDLGNGSILMSLESTGSFGILENIY